MHTYLFMTWKQKIFEDTSNSPRRQLFPCTRRWPGRHLQELRWSISRWWQRRWLHRHLAWPGSGATRRGLRSKQMSRRWSCRLTWSVQVLQKVQVALEQVLQEVQVGVERELEVELVQLEVELDVEVVEVLQEVQVQLVAELEVPVVQVEVELKLDVQLEVLHEVHVDVELDLDVQLVDVLQEVQVGLDMELDVELVVVEVVLLWLQLERQHLVGPHCPRPLPLQVLGSIPEWLCENTQVKPKTENLNKNKRNINKNIFKLMLK